MSIAVVLVCLWLSFYCLYMLLTLIWFGVKVLCGLDKSDSPLVVHLVAAVDALLPGGYNADPERELRKGHCADVGPAPAGGSGEGEDCAGGGAGGGAEGGLAGLGSNFPKN